MSIVTISSTRVNPDFSSGDSPPPFLEILLFQPFALFFLPLYAMPVAQIDFGIPLQSGAMLFCLLPDAVNFLPSLS
jgi:hypothetical protein